MTPAMQHQMLEQQHEREIDKDIEFLRAVDSGESPCKLQPHKPYCLTHHGFFFSTKDYCEVVTSSAIRVWGHKQACKSHDYYPAPSK